MKRVIKRIFSRYIIPVIISTVLLVLIDIAVNGMYLIGVPDVSDVKKVTISYNELKSEPEVMTDRENIDLAVHLTGFLKYSPFEKADSSDKPDVTITYFMSEGDEITVSASWDTVWWNGKAHSLKNKGHFIKMVQGIFFLGEAYSK